MSTTRDGPATSPWPRRHNLTSHNTMRTPSSRTWKLLAVSYAVKTLLFVTAWLFVPDLPQRISAGIQSVWSQLGETARE